MPRVATLGGIKVYLYYDDHEPPHFHAECAEYEMVVVIETGATLKGDLPRSEKARVLGWAAENRAALMENWRRAREAEPMLRING